MFILVREVIEHIHKPVVGRKSFSRMELLQYMGRKTIVAKYGVTC